MPRTPSPPEFKIHVDSSCLTDSTDLFMAPAERVVSDETVVHHDSWRDETDPIMEEDKVADGVAIDSPGESHEQGEASAVEKVRDSRERQINRIEAQIQAAARAVVASIERDHCSEHEDSVLGMQTDESYKPEQSQIAYNEGTELTYGDGTELTYDGTETSYDPHSEHEEEEAAGDSSSHHDGDIDDDDDVFSHNSGHSVRSSLNSIHELSSADEVQGKELTSPQVGEEAFHSSQVLEEDDTISRVPSSSSYAPLDTTPVTPSRVLSRPPFRTPSSVRALQMSSPTPSIFSSPRSSKRQQTIVSRVGTPTSVLHSPSKSRTPTRFKAKKEYPLVLLHVTVLPLTWSYSHSITSPELPESLQRVKENWRLLHEKLGDTVLERGILLPHPQESYEILEERLLEALELPVRPRVRILKCGHYMGPETPSSDEEGVTYFEGSTKLEGERKWCDICGRDVRLEGVDMAGREGEKRFRMKIYASNGLLRAGAWAACWREMERVDVEIEPFIEGDLASELEAFAAVAVLSDVHEAADDGYVDEEPRQDRHSDEHAHQVRAQQEEEMARILMEEEELRRRAQEEEDMRRKLQDEERMREIYGHDAPNSEPTQPRASRSSLDDDSLPDLLLKAIKVALRDRKNVAICVLSVIVLLLALRAGNTTSTLPQMNMMDSAAFRDIEMQVNALPIRDSTDGGDKNIPLHMTESPEVIRPNAHPQSDENTTPIVDTPMEVELPQLDLSDELPLEAAILGRT